LKAFAAVFGNIRFCPTGGIRAETARHWLALDAVLCVGGSWLMQPGDNFESIGKRARTAAALRSEQ
jgi:2-dehydro-3-deoxyphosphogluconate aldolase/(4S)-4-hydroxy-2-oxoglutarate aldolase